MTPIRVGDPLAAIGAYWSRFEEPAPETVLLLETLARSTATAIANVQLFTSLSASEQTARRQLETQRLLVEELNHRVKNTLATVQAIATQTLRVARDPDAFVAGFDGRLQALSRSHELFTRTIWAGADLATLIEEQLAIGNGVVAERIDLSGPQVTIEPQTAQHVGLVLHELATNARKYGALSSPDGRVDVTWSLNGAERPELVLRWAEVGGPPVEPPTSKGFGSLMIERGLRHIGAKANLTFASTGVSCEIRLPLKEAAATPAPNPQ